MAQDDTDPMLDEVVQAAHDFYRLASSHISEWQEEAKDCFALDAGEQWSQEDLAMLEEQERPAVTFNRIQRTINAIVGTQIANRQETRFIPRELGDVQVNEILTAAADWARDNCDAEDEESDSFRDMCICGMGWTETRMNYEINPEGDIITERVDPLEMYWDPSAKKRNLADAKRLLHIVDMDEEEFNKRWPDADLEGAGEPWAEADEDSVSTRTHVYPQDAYKRQQSGSTSKDNRIRVAHYQWCEYATFYRVGKRAERITEEQFNKLKKKIEAAGIQYMKQEAAVWKRAFIAGSTLLGEVEPCPFPNGPTFRCMTYMRDRNQNLWFGVVKAMADPQRFGNKFFSQILDILNKNSKGGLLAESDAAEDMRKVEEDWAKADAVIQLRPGAISQQKIMPKPIAQIPAGMDRLMGFSLDAVHEVTGINLELLGFANRQQAGVLEQQRKRAGLTIIAPLFDAMRRYRKEQGRILLHFIQEYISDGRLIRIMGQQGDERYIPLMRDQSTGVYDIIVDEAPTSPNMKERVYAALVEMLPALAKMGVPLPPEMLDYAPIPSALAQKWKELLTQGKQLPPEVQQQMQKLAQENQQLKTKQQERMLELQMKQQEMTVEAQLEQRQAEEERIREAQEAQFKAQLAEREQAMKRQQVEAELALEREKFEREFALQAQKTEAELMIKAASSMGDGENGGVNIQKMRAMFRSEPPRRRRVNIVRDPNGFISAADIEDIEDMEAQGNG